MVALGATLLGLALIVNRDGTVPGELVAGGASVASTSTQSPAPPAHTRISRVVGDVGFSFVLPETRRWERFGRISINKSIVGPQGAEAIIFWTTFPSTREPIPCAKILNPGVGPTAADLAAAVARAPGTRLLSGPTHVRVDGHDAVRVGVVVRGREGCDPGYFFSWNDLVQGAMWTRTRVGDTIRVWVVDVDGTRFAIEAATSKQADAELGREVEGIIESIRFDA